MVDVPRLPLRVGRKAPHQTIYDANERMVAVGITADDAAWLAACVNATASSTQDGDAAPLSPARLAEFREHVARLDNVYGCFDDLHRTFGRGILALLAEVERLQVVLARRNERAERAEEAEERLERLGYERRLLGVARMVLDLVAAGDPGRWEQLRGEAGDVAQRITDEIGHPVTDEPALGPGFREQFAQVRALADEWEETIASGAMRGQEWEQCLRANLPRLRAALGETEEKGHAT